MKAYKIYVDGIDSGQVVKAENYSCAYLEALRMAQIREFNRDISLKEI
ncbi:Hypothetical protein LUCI_1547 [Lucifera butyrica]|uniref:Uncharacterized protein n=1 Tax=Lucifera butyrica TaxID=1351585 RepID=A0A498R165_9FIRM|nr:hypothetical protein [Lucifera butyrica]VBB06316.1 Hypothetical protein LUCI_1547 [Lucifera butyrica]